MSNYENAAKSTQSKIISVANQKGGVGKTTTVLNIGAGLAKRGKNVLLLDVDPQNHLSRWLGYQTDGRPTASEMIYQEVSGIRSNEFENFIRTNQQEHVDYIPANHMLSGILSILGTDKESNSVLSRILHNDFFSRYDYILLDCQPALDLLVSNVLQCSDKLLIPVQADLLAYEGVKEILFTLQKIKQTDNLESCLLGMLVTMYQKNTIMSNSIFDALKKSYNNLVYDTPISYRMEAKNSTAARTSLVNDKHSKIGAEYMTIVDDIIARWN